MPTINGRNTDGYVQSYLQNNWPDLRQDTGSQFNVDTNDASDNDPILLYHTTGGRGTSFGIKRAFFDFNTSGITSTLTSATLNIRGYSNNDLDVIAVKSDQGGSLSTADFQAIEGAEEEFALSDGSGAGTLNGATGVTVYSAKFTSWTTSGWNSAAITAAGLSDITSEDDWRFCLMDYDYDFLDIEPPEASASNGLYWADDASYKPYIEYVVAGAVTDNATFFGANF